MCPMGCLVARCRPTSLDLYLCLCGNNDNGLPEVKLKGDELAEPSSVTEVAIVGIVGGWDAASLQLPSSGFFRA